MDTASDFLLPVITALLFLQVVLTKLVFDRLDRLPFRRTSHERLAEALKKYLEE